jgi:hypothetical protein
MGGLVTAKVYSVEVCCAKDETGRALMWEYVTVKSRGFEFTGSEARPSVLLAQLNSLGREGWEAVGVVPTDWSNGDVGGGGDALPTVGVLLKRRIPEE